jgi:hypothetical protein
LTSAASSGKLAKSTTAVARGSRVKEIMTVAEDAQTFEEWIVQGLTQGWCGAPVCYTHDGIPMSRSEDEEFGEGLDPCIHIIRMYEDEQHKTEVEEEHAPSEWRNHYTKKEKE